MLQIRNATISHKKDLHLLVEDFNLTLNPGDKAVLIGEEGSCQQHEQHTGTEQPAAG